MATNTRKANGQGSTYKIKATNSYRTVYRTQGRVVTATAKDRQTSRALAKAKLSQLPISQSNNLIRTTTLTLGEFLDRWLNIEHKQAIAHTTWRRYESLARMWIIPAIGNVTLRNLNRRDIKTFLASMANAGQSPRSRQQARALLCVALNAAMELNLISSNPAKEVPNITLNKKPITPLISGEVKQVLASVAGTFMEARLHLAVLCGLRQGEALGTRWSDIDFEKGLLTVTNQIQTIDGVKTFVKLKTASSMRTIALATGTLDVLKNHIQIIEEMKNDKGTEWDENDLVFPSASGKPLEASVDYSRWHTVLDQCGLTRRSLHNARHTAGTLLYENNVGIETIRRILGHSSVLITSNTYVHNAEKPLREAATTIDSFLSDKSEYSPQGLVTIESDLRAHCSPTRQLNISRAALALALRVNQLCPYCNSPGWGGVTHKKGVKCGECLRLNSEAISQEILSCVCCDYKEDGLVIAQSLDPRYCTWCNP